MMLWQTASRGSARQRKAKQFCRVILQLLGSTGLADAVENAISELGADVDVPPQLDDPFVIAVRLEKASQGLPSDALQSRFLDWKRRVWRFLAYCVDGGVAPKSLNIKTLVYNHGALVGYKRQQNLLGCDGHRYYEADYGFCHRC